MSDAATTDEAALPYPAGWAAVAFSSDIGPGDVVSNRAFGCDLVLFRGEDGELGVLDAYCPHMGAHLGQGGTVVGQDLVCPFHEWRWTRSGECAEIPYSRHAASRQARAWPCRDRNGFVYVWFDHDGRGPSWEVETIEETTDPAYRVTARKIWKDVRSYPQELNENGVDLPHFTTIHQFETRGVDWRPEGHTYRLAYDIDPLTTGVEGESEYWLESFTEGPCCTRTHFTGAIRGATLHSWLPTDPGILTVRSLYYFHESVSDEAAARAFENSQAGWARDVQIWNHKRYRDRPALVPEEEIVHRFRAWFHQFYPGGQAP